MMCTDQAVLFVSVFPLLFTLVLCCCLRVLVLTRVHLGSLGYTWVHFVHFLVHLVIFPTLTSRRRRQQRAARVVALPGAPHGRVVDHRRRRKARQIDGHQTTDDSSQRQCEEKNQDCVARGGGRRVGFKNVRHQ